MKKISLLSALLLSGLSFAEIAPEEPTNGGWPAPGGPMPHGPIDTNSIVLIVAAVVLILAMVAYKRINAGKVA